MAYFQTPTPVQIDQIDLGQIQNNNLRAQAMQMQNSDEQRKQNALLQYKAAVESGQSPDQAANAIRAIAPDMADRLSQNSLTYRTGQAALANDMDKFIQARVPLAKDQAGWDTVLNEASGRYGITIPDSLKTYSPQLQQQLLMGGLSAAQRIAQQRNDATAQALGLPSGVDPSTYASAAHSLQTAGQEAQMFPLRMEQARTGIANTQSEMQKRDELFPVQKQNLESEIASRADRRKVVMMPDPNDPLGMKKVPGVLVPGQNGEPDAIMPLQVAPEGMGGQPGGQTPRQPMFSVGGNIPGMVQQGNIDLTSRPRVKNADGSISTVRSASFNVDGKEVLVPTVSDDGRIMSDQEALNTFRRTGKHLGVFDTPQAATAYAQSLHQQQEQMYAGTQGQGQASQFKTADDVKAAYKAGKLSRDQAKAILQQQFRMQ